MSKSKTEGELCLEAFKQYRNRIIAIEREENLRKSKEAICEICGQKCAGKRGLMVHKAKAHKNGGK